MNPVLVNLTKFQVTEALSEYVLKRKLPWVEPGTKFTSRYKLLMDDGDRVVMARVELVPLNTFSSRGNQTPESD